MAGRIEVPESSQTPSSTLIRISWAGAEGGLTVAKESKEKILFRWAKFLVNSLLKGLEILKDN